MKLLFLAGTKFGRPSDWYDNITEVPTLWYAVLFSNQSKCFLFGMKASPSVGDLARKVDAVVPFPGIAPEYGEVTMQKT